MTRDEYGRAYQRGYELTTRLLISRGVKSEAAREAAQAAWARGWERLSQLRDDRLVLNWVNSIALNLYRGGLRQPVFQELPELRAEASVNLAALDIGIILKICRPADRVLLKQQILGLTAAETAHGMGVTETAVRIRWLRARRSARRRLERRARRLKEEHEALHRVAAQANTGAFRFAINRDEARA